MLAHVAFTYHGTCFHAGVNFITSTVEEAGVNKHRTLFGLGDTSLEVGTGTALFVHNAHFKGVMGQAQHLLSALKQLTSKGHFFRAVHLRLNDIHAASAGVAERAVAFQVVHGNQTGDQCIENAFWHLVTVFVQYRFVGHQVTDVTHKQQATAM